MLEVNMKCIHKSFQWVADGKKASRFIIFNCQIYHMATVGKSFHNSHINIPIYTHMIIDEDTSNDKNLIAVTVFIPILHFCCPDKIVSQDTPRWRCTVGLTLVKISLNWFHFDVNWLFLLAAKTEPSRKYKTLTKSFRNTKVYCTFS